MPALCLNTSIHHYTRSKKKKKPTCRNVDAIRWHLLTTFFFTGLFSKININMPTQKHQRLNKTWCNRGLSRDVVERIAEARNVPTKNRTRAEICDKLVKKASEKTASRKRASEKNKAATAAAKKKAAATKKKAAATKKKAAAAKKKAAATKKRPTVSNKLPPRVIAANKKKAATKKKRAAAKRRAASKK